MSKPTILENLRKYAVHLLLLAFSALLIFNIYRFVRGRAASNPATQIAPADPIPGTEAFVPSSVMNIGKIKLNHTAEANFKIVNTGTKPLIVLNAEVDCHCTLASWSKKPVIPRD